MERFLFSITEWKKNMKIEKENKNERNGGRGRDRKKELTNGGNEILIFKIVFQSHKSYDTCLLLTVEWEVRPISMDVGMQLFQEGRELQANLVNISDKFQRVQITFSH